MSKHVLVETNFLRMAFHMPHKRDRGARDLWDGFLQGELAIHIPYLCFQEAQQGLEKTIANVGDPTTEAQEIRRHLLRSHLELDDEPWNDREVERFFSEVRDYLRSVKTRGIKSDFHRAHEELKNTGGIIHGEDAIFDTMPLDAGHRLEYNDHLVLASVLHRARTIRDKSERAEVYFCTTDKDDLGPTAARPKLTKLYNDLGIVFQDHFTIP